MHLTHTGNLALWPLYVPPSVSRYDSKIIELMVHLENIARGNPPHKSMYSGIGEGRIKLLDDFYVEVFSVAKAYAFR